MHVNIHYDCVRVDYRVLCSVSLYRKTAILYLKDGCEFQVYKQV